MTNTQTDRRLAVRRFAERVDDGWPLVAHRTETIQAARPAPVARPPAVGRAKRRITILASVVIVVLSQAALATVTSFGANPVVAGTAAGVLLVCGLALITAQLLSIGSRGRDQ